MPVRRLNPNLVKLHRSYAVGELADRLGVHKNTVRQWQRDGLAPIDGGRPVLFQGRTVRAFLGARNASRKRPCPPGTLYCVRCREPRAPGGGMVDFIPITPLSGNLRAICADCGTLMHRRARASAVAAVLPGIEVQIAEAFGRLMGKPAPSPNSDFGNRGAP